MDTARTAKAHIIWTSIALVFILTVSCLTYVFMSKVPECQRGNISIVNVSVIENIFRRQNSRDHWLLTAQSGCQRDDYLIWEDEWRGYRHEEESVLDDTNTLMIIQEKGVYLVYIQVNFQLNKSNTPVELKILVHFSSDGQKKLFAAAQDTQVVNDQVQDAKLNTFLLMKLQPKSQLSVQVFPCDRVIYQAQPFSSFITIIKLADNW